MAPAWAKTLEFVSAARAALLGARRVTFFVDSRVEARAGYCPISAATELRLLLLLRTPVRVSLVAFCAETAATASAAGRRVLGCMFESVD